ncbi:MAG: 4'-phosphopantetheinyl transferase superfamily protein [Burkholderiaceae bacterium]|nr:4'-phosphopantetheinyl transferase superfamily protein [Burkholderiaceae bacterium]
MVAHAWQLLSAEERQRAVARHGDRLRNDFIVTRGVVRMFLSQYLQDTPPHAIQFVTSPQGKPSLDPAAHPNAPSFSISHCADLLLVGVAQAGQAFGVDVEPLKTASDDVLAREVLAPREYDDYSATAISRRGSKFLYYWTRKEAYLKAVGTGLIDSLATIDTSQQEVRVCDRPTGLFCSDLQVGAGHRAAFSSRDPLEVTRLSIASTSSV